MVCDVEEMVSATCVIHQQISMQFIVHNICYISLWRLFFAGHSLHSRSFVLWQQCFCLRHNLDPISRRSGGSRIGFGHTSRVRAKTNQRRIPSWGWTMPLAAQGNNFTRGPFHKSKMPIFAFWTPLFGVLNANISNINATFWLFKRQKCFMKLHKS